MCCYVCVGISREHLMALRQTKREMELNSRIPFSLFLVYSDQKNFCLPHASKTVMSLESKLPSICGSNPAKHSCLSSSVKYLFTL